MILGLRRGGAGCTTPISPPRSAEFEECPTAIKKHASQPITDEHGECGVFSFVTFRPAVSHVFFALFAPQKKTEDLKILLGEQSGGSRIVSSTLLCCDGV